jgi:dTDP-4-dehydrorhamnose 3,5-epimerase-like enzyme
MNKPSVFDCSLIELPKFGDRNGIITSINGEFELNQKIKRVFYLYDIPSGESRGAHAHKECHQFLIAVSGSFDILLDDSKTKTKVTLNQPNVALHVLPGIWASEINFSSGAICLVLATHSYNENDYIRNYEDYLNFKIYDRN